jgi:DNA topoisomerase-1
MKWIHRKGSEPSNFRYVTESGAEVSASEAERIDELRIPPAWRDVHIAANSRSAIQAWGYDVRGRKQYRYHPRAVQKGELRKFYRVRQMARDLPAIRRRLASDFRKRRMPKEKVLAGVIQLISHGFFRIGHERYLKENRTFGISTLNKTHVVVDGDSLTFSYVGKRSIKHKQVVAAPELIKFIKELQTSPGRRLFRYLEDERWRDVTARDVNNYFRKIAGDFPYTAKDLRTWGGTLRAATILAELGPPNSATEAKKNIVSTIRMVAAELGNTPAICRKSYVHPVILDRYESDGLIIRWRNASKTTPYSHSPEERALIAFLDEHFPERRKRRRIGE